MEFGEVHVEDIEMNPTTGTTSRPCCCDSSISTPTSVSFPLPTVRTFGREHPSQHRQEVRLAGMGIWGSP